MTDIYRAAKDLPKALQTGKDAVAKYPSDVSLRSSEALLLGESGQTDRGREDVAHATYREARRPRRLFEYRAGS